MAFCCTTQWRDGSTTSRASCSPPCPLLAAGSMWTREHNSNHTQNISTEFQHGQVGVSTQLDERFSLCSCTYDGWLYIILVGGLSSSPWVSVRTKSARPVGLSQPQVSVINSTAVRVVWSPPQGINGILIRYPVYSWQQTVNQLYCIIVLFCECITLIFGIFQVSGQIHRG